MDFWWKYFEEVKEDAGIVAMIRRPPKYNNKKTKIGDITFDSRKESREYLRLKALQDRGDITGLKLQVKFEFKINDQYLRYVDSNRVIKYIADFEYFDMYGNRKVVDVKGLKTRDYLIKKALMFACHGILIEEIT